MTRIDGLTQEPPGTYISRTKAALVEFKKMKLGDQSRVFTWGMKHSYDVLGIGKVKIPLPTGKSLYLSDVLFAPAMRRSVISVSQLAINGFKIRFKEKDVTIGLRS